MPPKTAKIKKALKSAARLPVPSRRRQTGSSSSESPDSSSFPTDPNVRALQQKRRSTRRGLKVGKLNLGGKGVGNGRGSGRNTLSPVEGENPLVLLRVQVVGCKDLLAKDRNGFSDPFATVSLPPHPTRHATPVLKRTLSPDFPAASSTFDFPIYLSLADKLGVLEVVLWDKDYFGVGEKIGMGRKEYLGEVDISVEEWFTKSCPDGVDERALGWNEELNKSFSIPLVSTRSNTTAKGTVELKIGFIDAPKHQRFALAKDALNAAKEGLGVPAQVAETDAAVNFEEAYSELVKRSRPSLVNANPTEGVGTVRSHTTNPYAEQEGELRYEGYQDGYPYEDDGGLSSSDSEEELIDEDGDVRNHLEVEDDSSSSVSEDTDDGDEDEDEDEDFRTPTVSPVLTSEPSPMTTPTGSGTSFSDGVNTPSSFSSLYTPPETKISPPRSSAPRNTTAPTTPLQRAPPPPHLNLTPASPNGTIVPPRPSSPTTPTRTPPRSPISPTRAATFTGTTSSSKPSSPGLSGMLPRMKFPKRSSSVNVTTTPTSESNAVAFDLTEEVPRLPTSSARPSMVTDDKEKKSRFRRSWNGVRRASSSDSTAAKSGSNDEGLQPTVNMDAASQAAQGKKVKKPKRKKGEGKSNDAERKKRTKKQKAREAYSMGGGDNDIVGIVMLEIEKAEDLPKLKNMTRLSWDMDPFVVISFGKKVFRTRVIRHSLNPAWDEKLLFHVRRYETNFAVRLTVLDWDKLSSNDYIGDCDFPVADLIRAFEEQSGVDPETGLYPLEDDAKNTMKEFKLPLNSTAKEMPWEAKHSPVITFRGKYQPYAALRQRFWFQYLKQYDTDDSGSLSHLEITSMLDSLGSTLTNTTINSFFTRFNKRPHHEELTMAEAIQCLETELGRPPSEKQRLGDENGDGGDESSSVSATPVMMMADRQGKELSLEELDFSGPPLSSMMMPGQPDPEFASIDKVPAPAPYESEPAQQRLASAAPKTPSTSSSSGVTTPSGGYDQYLGSSSGFGSSSSDDGLAEKHKASNGLPTSALMPPSTSSTSTPIPSSVTFASTPVLPPSTSNSGLSSGDDAPLERVINVKTCPLCHRPRLNSKAEVDIITHLAICASQDWNKVDRIVVGNFVTASQAQRKWYTKIIGKMSSGNYKLGANSANIIVQNRATGQLEEEKMQVYVRLGIRLLYKGMKSRMEGGRARRLLKSLSIKQGVKYDSPESVRDIVPFIEFHKLNMSEVRDPLDSFKTFNQFFYRKLKPDARPAESADDPYRLVSAADCRFMAFESVSEATRLWIKGREFTVERLLGDAYKNEAGRYAGGALAIFRLAPQDYHRFHSPVDGKIGKMTYISGEYYTVNPQAIRTALDVYGENARKIVPIDSPQFGRVMAVCVGAMMVGTIQTTVEEGQWVKRGEEFGYFAFGGSTIVLLFEKGVLQWDEDLLINGRAALETLVRVGMGIGTGLRKTSST